MIILEISHMGTRLHSDVYLFGYYSLVLNYGISVV